MLEAPNIRAQIIVNTILVVPDYEYSIIYTKTLFCLLRPLHSTSSSLIGPI